MKDKSYFIIILALIGAIILLGSFAFLGKEKIVSDSKECEWEKYYQGLYGSASVYRDITGELRKGGFVVPLDISYEEIRFKELGVLASTTEENSRFMLNGVDCGVLTRDIFVLHDFSESCLSALKEGLNSFDNTDRRVVVHEIYVGLEYKPANCL